MTRFLASPTADNPLAPPSYTVQSILEFDSVEQVKEAFAQAGEKVSFCPSGVTSQYDANRCQVKAVLARVSPIEPQIMVGEVIATRVHREVMDSATSSPGQAATPVSVARA